MKGRLTFEVLKSDHYYWHAKASNGKIIADGGEGYRTKSGAKRSIKRFITMIERGLYDIKGEEGKVE